MMIDDDDRCDDDDDDDVRLQNYVSCSFVNSK